MHQPKSTLLSSFVLTGYCACIAETITLPLDTAKVRLQLQNIAGGGPGGITKYRGPFGTLSTIIREEGASAPFKGLIPGLHRQFIFTGLRLGLYEHVRDAIAGSHEDASVWGRIAAALCTSALGITVANPSDVVKVRLQAANTRSSFSGRIPPGAVLGAEGAAGPTPVTSVPAYTSATHAYRRILTEEGVIRGLYRGYLPNLLRNSIISATELVVYDTAKHAFLHHGYEDGIAVHFSSGITAGFAATVLGSPWDVIGTRLMAASTSHSTPSVGLGAFCLNMLRQEGVGSFYKGFLPNFARIGSFNIVLWLSYEQIKHLCGSRF
ncbi:hypothetical protein WJX73_005333 [Symbiochloris irregularis]|uniref:Uncharacterized protein n=1 Tax=Symbiochloris irregularis TaxID=706552 RepID=A0AAW1NNE9_9CHLO